MDKAVRKKKAMKLRLEGYSYNEICEKLGIPKSTLSGWFRDVRLPIKAKERLKGRVYQGTLNGLVKHNKMQTKRAQERARSMREKAKKDI